MYLFLPLTKGDLVWPDFFFAIRVALLERDYCNAHFMYKGNTDL